MSLDRARPEPSIARAGLIPLSLVTVFVLIYLAHVPFLAAAAASLPFLLLFVLAPGLARRSEAAFDRDAVTLLATGAPRGLPDRLSRAVLMRAFSPPARVAERRGMIAAELGRHEDAQRAYRKAIDGYDEAFGAPMSVRLGYAHASWAAGDDPEAISAYRDLLDLGERLPKVHRNLAHALLRVGKELDDVAGLLDVAGAEARTEDDRAEITLLRAYLAARSGDRTAAAKLRRDAASVESELAERLRSELDEATSKTRRSKKKRATSRRA